MDVDSLTILKYRIQHIYGYKVMDKFDEPDEPKRLDLMIAYSNRLADVAESEDEEYEQLWIKTCPIFPTKG